MVSAQYVLIGVLLPAVLAGLALALAWRAWDRKGEGDAGPKAFYAGALALGAAFLLGSWTISGLPPVPFGERTLSGLEWLAWFVVLAAPVFALESALGRWRFFARGFLAVVLVERVLGGMYRNTWEGLDALPPTLALLVLLGVAWVAAERLAGRAAGVSVPLCLWLAGTGLAVCSGLTGSAKIAQLAGGLCAGLGAAFVVALWAPRVSLARGGVSLAVTVLFGLGICAHYYSELPALDAVLIALAPVGAWLGELPFARSRSPRARLALRAVGALAPIAVAVIRSALAFDPDPYDY